MAAITSFQAEKCCCLVSKHEALPVCVQQRPPVPDLYYIHTCVWYVLLLYLISKSVHACDWWKSRHV